MSSSRSGERVGALRAFCQVVGQIEFGGHINDVRHPMRCRHLEELRVRRQCPIGVLLVVCHSLSYHGSTLWLSAFKVSSPASAAPSKGGWQKKHARYKGTPYQVHDPPRRAVMVNQLAVRRICPRVNEGATNFISLRKSNWHCNANGS